MRIQDKRLPTSPLAVRSIKYNRIFTKKYSSYMTLDSLNKELSKVNEYIRINVFWDTWAGSSRYKHVRKNIIKYKQSLQSFCDNEGVVFQTGDYNAVKKSVEWYSDLISLSLQLLDDKIKSREDVEGITWLHEDCQNIMNKKYPNGRPLSLPQTNIF